MAAPLGVQDVPVALGEGQTRWMSSPVPVGFVKQARYLTWLYEKIKDVPGDIVECGVGEGGTFVMLAYFVGAENKGRQLWGFDSFEGWPAPTEWDKSPRNPQKGEWKVDQKLVWERLIVSKTLESYPTLHINIVPGFFTETLPEFPDRQIAFLHIDADLYPSYRDALHYLFPKVTTGGVVCFDEYKEIREFEGGVIVEKWPGASKAIDEYFADRPETIERYPETDKYYVVKLGACANNCGGFVRCAGTICYPCATGYSL